METVLPWPGLWHTWSSLRHSCHLPSQVPFSVQVSIAEGIALNTVGPTLVQRQTLYFPWCYKAPIDIWGGGALCQLPGCDLENLGAVTLRTLSGFCSLQGGAVPDHRLGGLVSAGPASPGPLQSGLVFWVEIITLQAQLWPKIMILWQGPQLGGVRHWSLMEQKWASFLSLIFNPHSLVSLGPQVC